MADGLQQDIFNQCALRRLDPKLREVVGFSAFVAIYKFSPVENQWKRTDVEGTLFVYARFGQPSHNILVLNRLNPINFIEPIRAELILQRRGPFLFYVTPKCSLYGIWFCDSGDCLRVSYIIEGIKRQLRTTPLTDKDMSDIATFRALMGMSDSTSNSDRISSGVQKSGNSDGRNAAQAKKSEAGKRRIAAQFSRLRDVNPGTSSRAKKSEDEVRPMGAGGVKDITIDEDEDQTPKSVVDFFARAGCAPINAQVGLMPGMTHMYGDDSEGAAMNPIVHQIVTNPYHSLEHVEKQQMMASSQRPTATSTQKQKGRTQKPKAANNQKPKSANNQKPKSVSIQKPKADASQKPKQGERKSSRADAPGSLAEFLTKLKISRSTNPGPEGRIEEIPDLLSMIPEPPIPNLASMPRPYQPIPFLPGHIGPIEPFHFIPGPIDAFGFMPGSSRPLPSFPTSEMGFVHPIPPEPSVLMPGPPPPLFSAPEPPASFSQMPAPTPPLSAAPEPATPLSPTPAPTLPLSAAPEPLTPFSLTPAPTPPLSAAPEPATPLSPIPAPIPPLSAAPEPLTPISPPSPEPLSPTPTPPIPLSSILRNARRSMAPKPALPKPLSLIPKPPESSISSMPPPVFVSKKSKDNVKDSDNNRQAGAAGNIAGEIGGGVGNINLHDQGRHGGGATAAPKPLPHTEGGNRNVETLTKDQLLQAIYHLLQNDPTFITKIHEAYLKCLTKKSP